MATTEEKSTDVLGDYSEEMSQNLARMEQLSERLATVMSRKKQVPASLQGPSPELYAKAGTAFMREMMDNPTKIMQTQIDYWGKTLGHYVEAQKKLMAGDLTPPESKVKDDSRFDNEVWQTHPMFNYLKQQYLMNAELVSRAVSDIDGLDPKDKSRLQHFSQQIVDMMSPTNFLGTNPEALARAVETEGKSLVDGLENLVRDLERNNGELVVTLADPDAFKVGENLATTPGKVVFRNRMMELIQYAPTTDQVHATPLIIFPPWINKFYILDLKEKNSLIRWIVDQGFTLFVVSWKNPNAEYADVGMDQYVEEGFLEAIGQVKTIIKQDKVNAVGYCIAGTTLSMTLALLKKRGDDSVNAATFFTTLTDFSDQGEVGVFLNDDFVDGIEEEVQRNGYLDSLYMSRTFSFLRSNDLVYRPAVRNYMLGEAPPAFDLLYWNGDGTNLPRDMAVEYLRGLCQGDKLATDGFPILGETVTLDEVTVPLMAVACETDHIAAWKSSFRGVQKMGSDDKTFVLSESGHIAGIVNPPSKKKYGHYVNGDWSGTPEDWQTAADFHEGTWWMRWGDWLAGRSGDKVKARKPGGGRKTLGDAPGTYVTESPDG
ncbi:Poly-beta-hydroxybutyrate polymerase [Rhodobacteraceae bacterium THAF1]|uniref:PHA/PHB synthase family protein n=1 Tax=Palleronia sp. THAF1 TaxID=2587842 RepID=UPI000F41D279|nr:class I poly(R)-hydroxyalkanoic acid synthase [Palleronia sp. THAF1]QFU09397.1 Poly-beta-hydroxybutyrate polymerase [Palleronia sp. THAF1]VDC21992.1 Poly-beta-hydroxybutyrate polymerase [Rhodobacteraceae bacterium THAF1]